jgi:hypothetical protein
MSQSQKRRSSRSKTDGDGLWLCLILIVAQSESIDSFEESFNDTTRFNKSVDFDVVFGIVVCSMR